MFMSSPVTAPARSDPITSRGLVPDRAIWRPMRTTERPRACMTIDLTRSGSRFPMTAPARLPATTAAVLTKVPVTSLLLAPICGDAPIPLPGPLGQRPDFLPV